MVTDEFLEELVLIKAELAHKYPNASNAELLIERLKALRKNKQVLPKKRRIRTVTSAPASNTQRVEPSRNRSADASSAPQINTAAIPATTGRAVLERAEHKCENCGSKFALQIDHIKPRAHGGKNEFQNLRALCRNCNQRAAILIFGKEKMTTYLNKNSKM